MIFTRYRCHNRRCLDLFRYTLRKGTQLALKEASLLLIIKD